MKKVFVWLLVATLIGGTVLFGFLYASVKQRELTIAARAPLSMQDLGRLVNELKDRGAIQIPRAEPASQDSATADVLTSAPLPDRLATVATLDILSHKFAHGGRGVKQDVKVVKVYEGLLQIIGKADSFTWQVGEMLLGAGEWDEARSYFYQALEESPNSFVSAKAASRLAWLEPDPEMAAYFLELSINEVFMAARIAQESVGSNVVDAYTHILQERLTDAIELCRATGSDALARHYHERLRVHFPEAAAGMEGEPR